MRVVSGKYRSRKIDNVESSKTRPTTDKNRESIFNMIGPYFQGGIALDLFSGSGALGIEALSRGVDFCYFNDLSQEAINVINKNIKTLKISDAKVFQRDYNVVLKTLQKEGIKLDLVFLDPPYQQFDINEIIAKIYDCDILTDDAIIVTETSREENLLDEISKLVKCKEKIYGASKVCVFRME